MRAEGDTRGKSANTSTGRAMDHAQRGLKGNRGERNRMGGGQLNRSWSSIWE